MYSVVKKMKFEAAHRITVDYDTPCKAIHGHSYKVEIQVNTKELNKNGMVIDFTELKEVQKWLDENFDHAMILSGNDVGISSLKECMGENQKFHVMPYSNTTAEHMTHYISKISYKLLQTKMKQDFQIIIRIWETEGNYAEFTGKWHYI